MLKGQVSTQILKVNNGVVRLCEDKVSCSYSIGLRTDKDMQFKYISKELHDLLVKELVEQEGNK
jgi:hypothetical protein